MLNEFDLPLAFRVTPTGLYLISTAYEGKRNVQFAFRTLGISDEPPLLLIGIQQNNFSREMIQNSGEFVINGCSENQLHAVNHSRHLSGRNVEDKFVALGLETIPAKHVNPPSLPAATPMWNAGSCGNFPWTDCSSSLVKRLPPILMIRLRRSAVWREKLIGWAKSYDSVSQRGCL